MNRKLWKARYHFSDIIGDSRIVTDTIRQAQVAAGSDITVLITGESGTGKELFAQSIHNEGTRSGRPFVSLNCAAISRELVEAELFGYATGAFTGAQRGGSPGKFQLADGGTLFLDEIGEMPLTLQAKLLRVLSEQEVVRVGGTHPEPVDVRLILATNRDLSHEVREGNFREDLYWRIATFTLRVPPLRHRLEDLPRLIEHFSSGIAERMGRECPQASVEFTTAMKKWHWPGNVRELQGLLEREILHLTADETLLTHVPDRLCKSEKPLVSSSHSALPLMTLAAMEEQLIREALRVHSGDMQTAAATLGISRATLYRKTELYGLR